MAPPPRAEDLKQRVNRCMAKLSDKDTESMAISELESMAISLPVDSLASFVSSISAAHSTDKTPLRRQPLRLLSLLSSSRPASALLPLLPRMLSASLRRLRDPDSSVRSSAVSTVRSLAASNPSSLSSILLPQISDALLHEQDRGAQSAAALCLAAAVDESSAAAAASQDHDLRQQLKRLAPRLVKLARSNTFKAKPAVIEAIGSVAGAGGASSENLLGMVVDCLVGFLGSEDWAARKAAAEALATVGLREREILGGFRDSCVAAFESRRFDKVKIVRESMNRMLEVWKDIPVVTPDGGDDKPLPNSSQRDSASDGRSRATSVSSSSPFSARRNKVPLSRSPPPNASPIVARKKNTRITERKSFPLSSRKTNNVISHVPPINDVTEEKFMKDKENNARPKFEANRLLFENKCEDKVTTSGGGLKSTSRVVPAEESKSSEVITEVDDVKVEVHGDHKDSDLSLIRRQLLQIEKQQSVLFDLLQRFIGSSQNGIHSLETRVQGIEMALGEISRDIAVTSGSVSTSDPHVKTCCSLPGAEFLNPKFWRRTDGGRFSLPGNPEIAGMRFLAEQQGGGFYKRRVGSVQKSFVVNPLAEINPQSRGNPEVMPSKMLKNVVCDS